MAIIMDLLFLAIKMSLEAKASQIDTRYGDSPGQKPSWNVLYRQEICGVTDYDGATREPNRYLVIVCALDLIGNTYLNQLINCGMSSGLVNHRSVACS